jgi:hypothetical protein
MEDQAVLGSEETAASMCVDLRGLGWLRSAALIASPRNWLKKALIIIHGLQIFILGRFTRSTQTLLRECLRPLKTSIAVFYTRRTRSSKKIVFNVIYNSTIK